MRLIDTHAHLCDDAFDVDREERIVRALDSSVTAIINAGTEESSSRAAAELARRPGLWAVAGVHPHQAAAAADRGLDWLEEMLRLDGVLGVGEIGLDYHYDFSPCPVQIQVFRQQLAIAAEHRVPVVVHNREADEDCLDALRRELPPGHPVLLHCFSGGIDLMRRVLELGYHIGLGGIVTFANARETREVAREVPLERLVLETDSPYLAPHPKRGRRNEPALVRHVAERISQIRQMALEDLAGRTTAAAEGFFGRRLDGEAGSCSI
ncbi:MAG: TatD family hydrolase [Bacillota bacterium]